VSRESVSSRSDTTTERGIRVRVRGKKKRRTLSIVQNLQKVQYHYKDVFVFIIGFFVYSSLGQSLLREQSIEKDTAS